MVNVFEAIYNSANYAYLTARDLAPEPVRDFMDGHPEASAAALGLIGGYVVTRLGQTAVEKTLGLFNKDLADKIIPTSDLVGMGMLVLTPLAISVIDPEMARETLTENPVFSAGMAGTIAGSATAGFEDFSRKEKRKARNKSYKEAYKEAERDYTQAI